MENQLNKLFLFSFIVFLFNFFPIVINAQHEAHSLEEKPSDPYIPVNRSLQAKSPAYQFTNGNFTCLQVNVDEDGNNILGDAANEPSIAIDPTDPSRMVMGWRQFDTQASNFRQAGFGYTIDGGETWTFPGVIEPGIFRSDPVLDFDEEGNFYYNSLRVESGEFWCDVFRSTGDGTWGDAVYAQGGDKQWMAIDRTGGAGDGNIYAFWNVNFSDCDGDFTRSTDGGDSYEDCISVPNSPSWGTLNVGPSGELYATGNGALVMKSSNAQNSGEMIEWDFSINVDLGGTLGAFADASPNPRGLLGQQWIATDHSGGPNHGNVYLLGSVFNNNYELDVHFIKSSDGGETWSDPIRINDDTDVGNWHWFGTMSVAPNGRIDVVWLDTRDFPGTYISSLYYSFSEDGGETWTPNQRLSDEFDPHLGWPNQDKMGDYFDMISTDDGAHLAWTATFNEEQDVYYGFITPEIISSTFTVENNSGLLSQNFPNPFRDHTTIPYSIKNNGHVLIDIFDLNGKKIKTLTDSEISAGNYQAIWDGKNENDLFMPSGVYYYKMQVNGEDMFCKKMIRF